MKLLIEFNENDIEWENNAFVEIVQKNKSLISIVANREGLISLAKQFLTVAYSKEDIFIHHWPEESTDAGYAYGDLEKGSLELFVMKVEEQGRRSKN